MLADLAQRGWVDVQQEDHAVAHAAWLDRWRAECTEDYAVFVHSDIETLAPWLGALVGAAEETGAAFACGELIGERPNYIEPTNGNTVRLAERPTCWMLLVDVAQARAVPTSFAFAAEETDAVPEGVIAYDTGGRLLADAREAGLGVVAMDRAFRRCYRHYGGLSWIPLEGRRGRSKARDLAVVERRLERLRRLQDEGEGTRRGPREWAAERLQRLRAKRALRSG
jgi:hypothetical protein